MKSQTPKFKLGDEVYGLIGGFADRERLVHGQISSVTEDNKWLEAVERW